MTTDTDATVLARVVGPVLERFPPVLAQAIMKLEFDGLDRERINHLSGKAREGALTDAERAELDRYIRISDFITILKSRARQSIRAKAARNGKAQHGSR